jgi:hypothetical protein
MVSAILLLQVFPAYSKLSSNPFVCRSGIPFSIAPVRTALRFKHTAYRRRCSERCCRFADPGSAGMRHFFSFLKKRVRGKYLCSIVGTSFCLGGDPCRRVIPFHVRRWQRGVLKNVLWMAFMPLSRSLFFTIKYRAAREGPKEIISTLTRQLATAVKQRAAIPSRC